MRYTHSTPVAVALHPTHVRSCTRLTQTEHASACLFTDTWDCTWRNRPCAKLPPPTAQKSSLPPPKNSPQIRFNRPSANEPIIFLKTPSPLSPSTPFAP